MIFIDTNVFMYAVGSKHPLQKDAQDFFLRSRKSNKYLVSSTEVAQELLHAYLPVKRLKTLDNALRLFYSGLDQIFDITFDDVLYARTLIDLFIDLTARDLLHLSVCHRHNIKKIKTYDQLLNTAFSKKL